MKKEKVLKKYFGHKKFRDGQSEIIDNILEGNDILGIMPTGAGKSMCYQVPALMMEGITIVISPLISLMIDQVNSLVQSGVAAAYINLSLIHISIRRLKLSRSSPSLIDGIEVPITFILYFSKTPLS